MAASVQVPLQAGHHLELSEVGRLQIDDEILRRIRDLVQDDFPVPIEQLPPGLVLGWVTHVRLVDEAAVGFSWRGSVPLTLEPHREQLGSMTGSPAFQLMVATLTDDPDRSAAHV